MADSHTISSIGRISPNEQTRTFGRITEHHLETGFFLFFQGESLSILVGQTWYKEQLEKFVWRGWGREVNRFMHVKTVCAPQTRRGGGLPSRNAIVTYTIPLQ